MRGIISQTPPQKKTARILQPQKREEKKREKKWQAKPPLPSSRFGFRVTRLLCTLDGEICACLNHEPQACSFPYYFNYKKRRKEKKLGRVAIITGSTFSSYSVQIAPSVREAYLSGHRQGQSCYGHLAGSVAGHFTLNTGSGVEQPVAFTVVFTLAPLAPLPRLGAAQSLQTSY